MKSKSILTTRTFTISVLAVLIACGFYLLLIKGEFERLQTTVSERDLAEEKLLEIEKKKSLISQAEQQYKSIQDNLVLLDIAIPQESNTGLMTAALEGLANEKGLRLVFVNTEYKKKVKAVQTEDPEKKNEEKETTTKKAKSFEEELLNKYHATIFNIQLEGSFDTTKQFIDSLLDFDRYVVMTSVNMTSKEDNPDLLTTTITFWAYHKNAFKADVEKETNDNEKTED